MAARQLTPHRGAALRQLGDHLLTVLAVVGTLCIVLVVLSSVFHISIVMFRTGSMSPTIPAGSIAFVQEIPATEMEEGDVVTVDRGERVLPVTHRVVGISGTEPATGEVTFTMRGDGNDVDDPEPYTAAEVQRVLFSIPGAARVVRWFSDPFVLGGITVAATVLVVWAFWPRARHDLDADDSPPTDGVDGAQPSSGSAVHQAVGLPLCAALVLAAPGPLGAQTTLIEGEHLRIETTGDPSLMKNLVPGRAVTWDVGIWAEAPGPGEVQVGLTGGGELARLDDALLISVRGCSERWERRRCPSGAEALLENRSLDSIVASGPELRLTTLPSDEELWLRIDVTLDETEPVAGADADLLVHASGAGEEISTGPGGGPGADGPAGTDGPEGAGGGAGSEDAPGLERGSDERGGGAERDRLSRTGVAGVTTLLAGMLLALALGAALRRGPREEGSP